MNHRSFACLFALAAMVLAAGRTAAQNSTLLADNFTQDSTLNTTLWTTSSSFLNSLAAASSSPAGSFVAPQLDFSSQSGMQLTGPNQDYEFTGVQSLSTFSAPFTVVVNVTAVQGTANPFEIYLASADLTEFTSLAANVSPTYDGFWANAPNVSQIWQLGEQFSPPILPSFNTSYTVTVVVDGQGQATTTVSSNGTTFGTVSGLQVGTGQLYLVLAQRIGLAPTGSQVASWANVGVTVPSVTTISSSIQMNDINVYNSAECELGGNTCFSIQQNFWVQGDTWFQNAVQLEFSDGWYARQVWCEYIHTICPVYGEWIALSGPPFPLISLVSSISGNVLYFTASFGQIYVNTYSTSVPAGSSFEAGPLSSKLPVGPRSEPELILVGEGGGAEATFYPQTSGYVTGGLANSGGSEPTTLVPMTGACQSDSGETESGLGWLVPVLNKDTFFGFNNYTGDKGVKIVPGAILGLMCPSS